jgi:hypothetical protein
MIMIMLSMIRTPVKHGSISSMTLPVHPSSSKHASPWLSVTLDAHPIVPDRPIHLPSNPMEAHPSDPSASMSRNSSLH